MFMKPGLAVAALWALVLVVVPAVLPLAAADHVYSHRYIVYGRVVDASGDPVSGLTMDLGFEDIEPDGPCASQPFTETDAFGPTQTQPITNEFGEFIFCMHVHSMARSLPGTGILVAEGTSLEHRFEFDPYIRHSYLSIQLDEEREAADGTVFEETYTVVGTAWRPAGSPVSLEGVRAFGETVDQKPVTVRVTFDGAEEPVEVATATNNYGDFAVRVPVPGSVDGRPSGGLVEVLVENETLTADVAPTFGVTYVRGELSKVQDPFIQNALVILGVVGGIAVIGGGGYYGIRKMTEAREAAAARASSTRKRANK